MSRDSDCAFHLKEAPVVSQDSIGALRLDEPMSRLRQLCSTARDTSAQLGGGGSPTYPGVVFRFDSLSVIALQYGTSSLDPNRVADGWIVTGARATIQRKVPLSASWSTLYTTLGTVQVSVRGVVAARFCSFPNAIITLRADPRTVVTRGGLVDLSSIPADATIHHLFIMRPSLSSHLLGC